MEAFFANWFFNPGFVAGGAALIASPILIHLINRMRYRRVRFAAMEFLLQSQQRNRRRLLMEQLLLLLLRVLIVLAIVLLIARLILDPSQLSIFREGRTHHLVLLDDSLSTRDRVGEENAFAEALEIIRDLVAEGARRPDTQRFSLMRLSDPEQPFFSQRDVNQSFVLEAANKLDPKTFLPTHQAGNLLKGLQTAKNLLAQEKTSVRQLHFISDFRSVDWLEDPTVTTAIEEITALGVTVNLVRTVGERNPNLTIVDFNGPIHVATAGVPLRLKVRVRNDGTEAATNVRVTVSDEGVALPASLLLERIDANTEAEQEFEVRLAKSGLHRLQVALDADAFVDDNVRYLAVQVADALPVMIVEGDPTANAGAYLMDALAADPQSTGISAVLQSVDDLRRRPLDEFRALFLVDVPELPPDTLDLLHDYVEGGGGLVWFLGPSSRPAWYTETAVPSGLFPAPLAVTPQELVSEPGNTLPDLQTVPHPIFAVLQGQDNPFLSSVHIRRFWGVDSTWNRDDSKRGDGVKTLARLRNGHPLILEQLLGSGRILTCLTTADPTWNDWASNPSYVVVQLDMLREIASRPLTDDLRVVGTPIRLILDPAKYSGTVEILSPSPEGIQRTRLQASPRDETGKATAENAATPSEASPLRLGATFLQTDRPGIYTVKLQDQSQESEEQQLTYNIPIPEGRLDLISSVDLRKKLNENPAVLIHEPGQRQWVKGEEVGSEVRQALLVGLIVLLLAEQALAYKLSYHPKTVFA